MSGLTGSAAAALGPQQPVAQVERLAWVDVEDAPRMIEVLDPTSGQPLGWYAEVEHGSMTDPMATKFRAICDAIDSNSCEADNCIASPYERKGVPVGAGIGWVLAGEADERTIWRPVTLVQRGTTVIAVCEDCSPTRVYPGLWPTT